MLPMASHSRWIFSLRVISSWNQSILFIDDYNFLPHPARDFAAGGHRFIRSMRRPHQFDESRLRHRIEEMHADAAIARNGDVREIRNRKRRRIACENRAGLGEFVKDGEEFQLHLELFRNGFDDELGVTNRIFDVACGGYQRKRFIAYAYFNLAASDTFLEGLLDPSNTLFEHLARNIFEDRIVAAQRSGVGNSPPHRARANYCNRLYIHPFLFCTCRDRSQKRARCSLRWRINSIISDRLLHQIREPFAILEARPAGESSSAPWP